MQPPSTSNSPPTTPSGIGLGFSARQWWPTAILSVWTLFVWGGRVRNIAADPDLQGWSLVWRLGLAGSFVCLALALGAGLVIMAISTKSQHGPGPAHNGYVLVRTIALTLAGWGTSVWLVRGVDIALGDHPAGFKAVHTALALVTIGFSAWLWLILADRPDLGVDQVDK